MTSHVALPAPAWDEAAAERAARLGLVEDMPDAGFWTWEPATDRLEVSPRFRALLGLDDGEQLTFARALATLTPQDAEEVRALLDEMVEGRRDELVVTYRLCGGDGVVRWLSGRGTAVRSPDGVLRRVVGLTTDQTERLESAEKLRESSAFWQATIDSLTAHVAVLDSDGTIIALNSAWVDYATSHEDEGTERVGDNYIALCAEAEDPLGREVAAGLEEILAGDRETAEWTYPWESSEGRRWFTMRATRFSGAGETRLVIAQEDVTERHEAEAEAKMRAELLDLADAAVIQTDLDRRVLTWSEGAERMYGWSAEEAVGRTTVELLKPQDLPGEGRIEGLIARGSWQGELGLSRKDGTTVDSYFRMRVVHDEDGHAVSLVGVAVDVSAHNQARRDLEAVNAYLRAVTDSMGEAMFTLDQAGRTVYLNPAAERLLGWSNEEALGRSMHHLSHAPHPDGTPFPSEECPIAGARTSGQVVRVADDVFRRKDGTLIPVRYTASPFTTGDGAEGCVVLLTDISELKREEERIACDRNKLLWLRRVREALADHSFELYAQPIVSCATGQQVQRELLLRMNHPELDEPALPGSFLPVAEELGLITEIDRRVITQAAQIAAGGDPVELNVSTRSIADPTLVGHIEHALEAAGADPKLLVFEITETALLEDEAAARRFVERLHRLGCGIALDDFGTGYGTFTYLKQLPIDTVKIDMEFVRDLRENPASAKVVRAVLNVARDFGLTTVAEGVEDAETFELLKRLGVDCAQGYYFGRPAPLPASDGSRQAERAPGAAEHAERAQEPREAAGVARGRTGARHR